jgi:hypothetical protein
LEAVEAWKEATPGPPLSLERKIAEALAAARRGSGAPADRGPADRPGAGVLERKRRRVFTRPVWGWAAAAAVLLFAVTALSVVLTRPWEEPGVAEVFRELEDAEQRYVRAIARLEQKSATILARAGDPALPPEQAALLLSYHDRLAHLDSVLADVRGFLEENPGHSGGHTVLLAAYKEKATVLREVLELQLGVKS